VGRHASVWKNTGQIDLTSLKKELNMYCIVILSWSLLILQDLELRKFSDLESGHLAQVLFMPRVRMILA
jgi:hypothetical protein